MAVADRDAAREKATRPAAAPASAAGAAAAVRVRGLWKRYGSRDALAGISLEAPRGSCHAVFGPNGSGKTTLLRILSTLALPTEGSVEVCGFALPASNHEVRRRIGVVLDQPLLPRDFTLEEAMRYYADLYGLRRPAARIQFLAKRFGLEWRLRDPVRTFSKGMGQRASLMRALLHEPEVLLLDEPFSGLDPSGRRIVEEVVREATRGGCSVLLVTHDVARGQALARTATVITAGRVTYEGAASEAPRLVAPAARAAGGTGRP